MKDNLTSKSLQIVITYLFALITAVPIYIFEQGEKGLWFSAEFVTFYFAVIVALEVWRRWQPNAEFLKERSFIGNLKRGWLVAFLMAIQQQVFSSTPSSLAFFPAAAGVSFGLSTGMKTRHRYATLDQPDASNLIYWRGCSVLAVALAFAGMVISLIFKNFLFSLGQGVLFVFGWPLGVWIGLYVGSLIPEYLSYVESVYFHLKRIAPQMCAFMFGYLLLIYLFACGFAAIWTFDKNGSFCGLSGKTTILDFVYFSMSTASTVGYGDITPCSALARVISGLETLLSLGWTLVMFAGFLAQFQINNKPD